MAGLIRKLFGVGKLPTDMRAEVESEGLLHISEFIAVIARFTGQIPGRRSVGLVRSYGGGLVLTNHRVLGIVSAIPGKAGRAVDLPWTAPPAGAVTGTLSESGLLLDIPDLSRVNSDFSGTLSLTFKSELSADVLSRVPTRTLAFDVPPKFVYGVLGVPRG